MQGSVRGSSQWLYLSPYQKLLLLRGTQRKAAELYSTLMDEHNDIQHNARATVDGGQAELSSLGELLQTMEGGPTLYPYASGSRTGVALVPSPLRTQRLFYSINKWCYTLYYSYKSLLQRHHLYVPTIPITGGPQTSNNTVAIAYPNNHADKLVELPGRTSVLLILRNNIPSRIPPPWLWAGGRGKELFGLAMEDGAQDTLAGPRHESFDDDDLGLPKGVATVLGAGHDRTTRARSPPRPRGVAQGLSSRLKHGGRSKNTSISTTDVARSNLMDKYSHFFNDNRFSQKDNLILKPLSKTEAVDFLKDLPYKASALDDAGRTVMGRRTSRARAERGPWIKKVGNDADRCTPQYSNAEDIVNGIREEGMPVTKTGDVSPALIEVYVPGETALGSESFLDDTLRAKGADPGSIVVKRAQPPQSTADAAAAAMAALLTSTLLEGRASILRTNSLAVAGIAESLCEAWMEGGFVAVDLVEEGSSNNNLLALFQQHTVIIVDQDPQSPSAVPESALLAKLQVLVATLRMKGCRSIVAHGRWYGTPVLRQVLESIKQQEITQVRQRIERALASSKSPDVTVYAPPYAPLELYEVPADRYELVHEFILDNIKTHFLTLISLATPLLARDRLNVVAFGARPGKAAGAASRGLDDAIRVVGCNVVATDAIYYYPQCASLRGVIGNSTRFQDVARSVLVRESHGLLHTLLMAPGDAGNYRYYRRLGSAVSAHCKEEDMEGGNWLDKLPSSLHHWTHHPSIPSLFGLNNDVALADDWGTILSSNSISGTSECSHHADRLHSIIPRELLLPAESDASGNEESPHIDRVSKDVAAVTERSYNFFYHNGALRQGLSLLASKLFGL